MMENLKTAKIISGKEIAAQVRAELKSEIEELKAATGTTPGLTVVLVGENPASLVYVRNKIKACEEVGIKSVQQPGPPVRDQAVAPTGGDRDFTINCPPGGEWPFL